MNRYLTYYYYHYHLESEDLTAFIKYMDNFYGQLDLDVTSC